MKKRVNINEGVCQSTIESEFLAPKDSTSKHLYGKLSFWHLHCKESSFAKVANWGYLTSEWNP